MRLNRRMGAKPNPARKAALLDALVEHLLGEGVADASLRPVANAVGTSARMLLYHFRTKEDLVDAALREVRAREQAMLLRAIQRRGAATVADMVDHVWRWYTTPRREPYLRLFFEVLGLAIQNPARFPGFLETVRTDLLSMAEEAMVQSGFPRDAARTRATFYIGTLRGLLLDWLATKDRPRLEAAAAQLAALMQDDLARVQGRSARRQATSARTARRRVSARGA
jgi:AcrR family transcriptional regulator